jgi:hypothetical protein
MQRLGQEPSPNQAIVRCVRLRIESLEQREDHPRRHGLPEATADTRRQSTASDDRANGAEWHMTTLPDTTRHYPTRQMGSPKPQAECSSHFPPELA